MDDDLLLRYSRHILLDDIGIEGQQLLCNSRVLLVGAGGLGCPAALYLASAGVGEIILCDDDYVDLTNLQRQIAHTTDRIGLAKTESARQCLSQINPHCHVRTVSERLNVDNITQLATTADVIIDSSDNYATRHLINQTCVQLRKPLIFGAAIGFDGQASVFDSRYSDSPCYNCLFSKEAVVADVSCSQLGVFAPLTGIIGCIQAAQAIWRLIAPDAPSLMGRLLLMDSRDMRWRNIHLPRDQQCSVCHAH